MNIMGTRSMRVPKSFIEIELYFLYMDIKNPAFIGALGLIALVLGLTGWYMSTHPAPAPYTPVARDELETDVPERIYDQGDYYTIDVSYPTQITFPLSSRSDAGDEAERVVRAWIDRDVAEFKQFATENRAAIQDFVEKGEEIPASFRSMYLTVNYEKKRDVRTLTYLFRSASFTGGAHGLEVPVTFTFDRTTGKQILLADLFAPEANYLERLSTIARSDLPAIIGEYTVPEFVADGTEPRDNNFETFYLEGDTLVFLFPPYQVAPYVVGTVELPIKLSELSDILRTEYK